MKIVICEHEPIRAEVEKKYVLHCIHKFNIDASIEIVESGRKLILFRDTKYSDVDLIYLIYHMSYLDGMETAKYLRTHGYKGDIIFLTLDPTHASEGYDVDALSYIVVKGPIDETYEPDEETLRNFEAAFLKACRHCLRRSKETMTFLHNGEHRNVILEDIIYFEVLGHTVTVHYYKDNKTEQFNFNSTLAKVEKKLLHKGFLRTHKSYLVAARHIYKQTAHHVEMSNGELIPIGRSLK
jgi:DNA-binding LytR/AlgR family response regulator